VSAKPHESKCLRCRKRARALSAIEVIVVNLSGEELYNISAQYVGTVEKREHLRALLKRYLKDAARRAYP